MHHLHNYLGTSCFSFSLPTTAVLAFVFTVRTLTLVVALGQATVGRGHPYVRHRVYATGAIASVRRSKRGPFLFGAAFLTIQPHAVDPRSETEKR